MKKAILVATCIAALSAVTTVCAFAQTGGSAAQESSTAAKDKMGTDGMMKKDGMEKSSTPSAKDASTQGAGTAGAVDKKGDAASPGGAMKK